MKSLIKKTQFILLLLIFGLGCTKSPETTYNDIEYHGLVNPLVITRDSMHFIPYHFGEYAIDSIVDPKHSTIELAADSGFLVSPGQETPALFNLTVLINKVPFGIPVIYAPESLQIAELHPMQLDLPKSHLIKIKIPGIKYVLAYWNNLQMAVKTSNDLVEIEIPPFAKYSDYSHICVYSMDEGGFFSQSIIPLQKGKVVLELNKLRKDMVSDGIKLSLFHYYTQVDFNYFPILDRLSNQELDKPRSVILLYGLPSLLEKDHKHVLFEIDYFNQKQYLLLNNSAKGIKLNYKGTEISAPGYGYGLSELWKATN